MDDEITTSQRPILTDGTVLNESAGLLRTYRRTDRPQSVVFGHVAAGDPANLGLDCPAYGEQLLVCQLTVLLTVALTRQN